MRSKESKAQRANFDFFFFSLRLCFFSFLSIFILLSLPISLCFFLSLPAAISLHSTERDAAWVFGGQERWPAAKGGTGLGRNDGGLDLE
jgi:hypothetical protein